MNYPNPRDEHDRFKGGMRHYHRAGNPPDRTWDDWIDGKSKESRSLAKWFKIALVVLTLLALAGIIAGLVVTLS